MSRLLTELIPDANGAGDLTAEFTGSPNQAALERATEITIYGGTAAAAVEISIEEEPGSWVATGTTIAAGGLTTLAPPPACRAIRVAGEVAATPAPVRILVRHGM